MPRLGRRSREGIVTAICVYGNPATDHLHQLMAEALPKNFIDYEEYPQTADIQNRCVSMIARLFNAPTQSDDENAMGTSSVGSSEAIMLATLAMKKRWQNKRKADGKDYSKPNIIMSSAVQVVSLLRVWVSCKIDKIQCWEKAARYFELEEKYVNCTEDRCKSDFAVSLRTYDPHKV